MEEGCDVGETLIKQGWDQGCLMPAIGHAFFQRDADETWRILADYTPEPGEQLIVVSQACDIDSSTEPFIEAMPCSWERKGSPKFEGARVGNSGRFFLVRKEPSNLGEEGGLVVDATRRVQVAKESLEGLTPTPPVDQERLGEFAERFRPWLGGRYSRPALATPVVEAVQKPIVEAIRALRANHDLYQAPELVREVRMHPVNGEPPYVVDLIVLVKDDVSPDDELIAGFRGLLEEALNDPLTGNRLGRCDIFTAEELTVKEYTSTQKIALDRYTVRGEEIRGAGPVHGIDHG